MLVPKIVETFDYHGRMLALSVYAAYMELKQNNYPAGYNNVAKAIGYNKYVVRDILDWIKKQENTALSVEVNYSDGLAKEIEEAFLDESKHIYKWSRERKAINNIIQRASQIDTDNVDNIVKLIVSQFYKLCKSGDKFWNTKPFLPSELVKDYAWTRVYTVAKNEMRDAMEAEYGGDIEKLDEVFNV